MKIDRRYRPIGPLNSLYSFNSRSKTIVELIVAVKFLVVFEENDPQESEYEKRCKPALHCLTRTSYLFTKMTQLRTDVSA